MNKTDRQQNEDSHVGEQADREAQLPASPGTRLLIYHDPDKVWVDANVKETDFGRIKVGAPVRISVDAYPAIEFKGEVVRLGHAATSQFALLPSPNPSGNFTKITQRLPIRVAIEQREDLLRPGMMVELSVDVVDRGPAFGPHARGLSDRCRHVHLRLVFIPDCFDRRPHELLDACLVDSAVAHRPRLRLSIDQGGLAESAATRTG